MTGFMLSQQALHAALGTMRTLGAERDNDGDAAAFFIDALNVLEALFDPKHQPPAASAPTSLWASAPLTAMSAAAMQRSAGPAPTLAQEESQPAHADSITAADPPLTIPPLPAGPGCAAPADRGAPAAESAAPEPATPPAPPPDLAAERHHSHDDAAPTQASEPHARRVLRQKSAGGRPKAVWTLDRDALLRAEFPTCTDTTALFARINATGDAMAVASVAALGQRAIKLGLRRAPEVLRAVMLAGARKGLKAATDARLTTLAGDDPHTATNSIASAVQQAALRQMWPTGATVPQIMARLSAMDGPTITGKTTIYRLARALGLPVPRPDVAPAEPTRDHFADAGKMVPAGAAPAPPAPPAAPPPPPEAAEELSPEEQARIADAAVEARHARVKDSLRQLVKDKRDRDFAAVAGVAKGHKVSPSVAVRLLSEVRQEKAA